MFQPRSLRRVMDRAIPEMGMTRLRARQIEPLVAARGPAMHHRISHIGVKLKPEGMPRSERLDRKVAALRQQFGSLRKVKSLAVPMIDMIRPVRADLKPSRGRMDPVIS